MARTSDAHAEERPWHLDNRWKLGAALLTAAGWLWRQRRRRSIKVDRMSDQWLTEHEVEEGREPPQ